MYAALQDVYDFKCRGRITVKGKGDMITYFLLGKKGSSAKRSPISTIESPQQSRSPSGEFKENAPLVLQSTSVGKELERQGSQKSQSKSLPIYGAINIERKASIDSIRVPSGTPTSSLNKKRKNSTDSPRDSSIRNPLRKLSSSSLTNCITGDVTYARVESPELPTVHYINIKMQGNSADKPTSPTVHNEIFDKLKTSTSGDNGLNTEERLTPNRSVLSLNASSASEKSFTGSHQGNSPNKIENNAIILSPISPNSPLQVTPLVFVGAAPAIHKPLKQSATFPAEKREIKEASSATSLSPASPNQVFSKEIAAMDSMLKELEKVVDGDDPEKKPLNSKPSQRPSLPARQTDDRLPPVPKHSKATENGNRKHPVEQNVPPPLPERERSASQISMDSMPFIQKPKPFICDSRKPSPRSCSVHSNRSPTCAILASIDGKTMSILPAPFSNTKQALSRSPSEKIRTSRENFDESGHAFDRGRRKSESIIQGIRSPSANDKKGRTIAICSPVLLRAQRETSSISTSDDDLESVSSQQSSVVLLQPIELKPPSSTKPACKRQLSCPETQPVKRTLFRNKTDSHSRSSESLSSCPCSPPLTPRFPVRLHSKNVQLNRLLDDLTQRVAEDDEDHDEVEPNDVENDRVFERCAANIPKLAKGNEVFNRSPNQNETPTVTSDDLCMTGKPPAGIINGRIVGAIDRHRSYMNGKGVNSGGRHRGRRPESGQQRQRFPTDAKNNELDTDASTLESASEQDLLLPQNNQPKLKTSFAWQPRHKSPLNHSSVCRVDMHRGIRRESSSPVAGGSNDSIGGPVVPTSANGNNNNNNNRSSVNPFQVKRRQVLSMPPRYCRSLDYIPSDREDYVSSNASSAAASPKIKRTLMVPYYGGLKRPIAFDNLSMCSFTSSSEMSKSDPMLNIDSVSVAYESEYDNYRPGMTSDEDCFMPGPISDVDMDIFDDINVDNVTVSDSYSLNMPLSITTHKKITDV